MGRVEFFITQVSVEFLTKTKTRCTNVFIPLSAALWQGYAVTESRVV